MSLFLAPWGHTPHCHNPICSRGDGRVSTVSPYVLSMCDPALGGQQLLPPTANEQELHLRQVNVVPFLQAQDKIMSRPESIQHKACAQPSLPGFFQVYRKLAENWTFLWGLAGSPKAIPLFQSAAFQCSHCPPILSLSIPQHLAVPQQLWRTHLGEEHRANCLVLNISDTSDADTARFLRSWCSWITL